MVTYYLYMKYLGIMTFPSKTGSIYSGNRKLGDITRDDIGLYLRLLQKDCLPRMSLSGIQSFQSVRIWIPARNLPE